MGHAGGVAEGGACTVVTSQNYGSTDRLFEGKASLIWAVCSSAWIECLILSQYLYSFIIKKDMEI